MPDPFTQQIIGAAIEIKANEKMIEVHEAQLLTYLRVTGLRTGLLLNFNSAMLSKGIKRISL